MLHQSDLFAMNESDRTRPAPARIDVRVLDAMTEQAFKDAGRVTSFKALDARDRATISEAILFLVTRREEAMRNPAVATDACARLHGYLGDTETGRAFSVLNRHQIDLHAIPAPQSWQGRLP